jgi:hypothetical protein
MVRVSRAIQDRSSPPDYLSLRDRKEIYHVAIVSMLCTTYVMYHDNLFSRPQQTTSDKSLRLSRFLIESPRLILIPKRSNYLSLWHSGVKDAGTLPTLDPKVAVGNYCKSCRRQKSADARNEDPTI